MKYLQETAPASSPKVESNSLKFFHFMNFCFIIVIFFLNFIGHPSLKFVYLPFIALVLLSIFCFKFEEVLPEIFALFFMDGQIRILWEYQPWARILLDITLLLAIVRIFITHKKFYNNETIPRPIIVLILLHFLWYIIQLFNINAASYFGVIAAMKIYIFPIFLFMGLTFVNFNFQNKEFKLLITTLIFILILELTLNFYQTLLKQDLLLQISNYYFQATRNGVFTGLLFRPFATTYYPGALSVYLYLTVGLLFLYPVSLSKSILRLGIIAFSLFNLILCQIRSATIKYILIIALIYIGDLIYHRLSLKKLIPAILTVVIVLISAQNFLPVFINNKDENLSYSLERTTSLLDLQKMKSQRINIDNFTTIIFNQLSKYPLGVGPGMTGAASSINADFLKNDPFLNRKTLWTFDNLYISLVIDLGFGAIIYILLLFMIPLYFIKKLFQYYKDKVIDDYRILLICTNSIVVILLGNWGLLGITYNPESFIFWLFAAMGFLIISANNKRKKSNQSN